MSEATAWIAHFEGGFQAAIGEREMLHIIANPLLEDVPQTPVTCQRVLIWENDILPVANLTAWLTNRPSACDNILAGIVGWQPQEDTAPQYGALLFDAIPQKVRVNDEQACDLPTQPPGWLDVAIACFLHEGHAIPVLDIPRLFSPAPIMTSSGS